MPDWFHPIADTARAVPVHHRRLLIVVCLFAVSAILHAQTQLVLGSGTTLSPLAGSGIDGQPRPGVALTSPLGHPAGLVYDSSGNLFLADSRNNQVLELAPTGSIRLVAGTGAEGFAGDGGPAANALLNRPTALALMPDGTLLIADIGNHRIRSVSPAGQIGTIAGNGTPGSSGDEGPATAASLRRPSGLAFDTAGALLIADTGNHRIRRLTADGFIHSAAGSGVEGDSGDGGPASAATFLAPVALLTLTDGRVLIADQGARRIRVWNNNGTVAAYMVSAELRRPQGIATDAAANIVIADAGLQRIVEGSAQAVDIVAGDGNQGPAAVGGATNTPLDSPAAVVVNSSGDVVFSDRRNHRVERVSLPALNFKSVPAGQQSAAQALTMKNGGASPLRVLSVTMPTGFAILPSGSCPTLPFSLAANAQCAVNVVFRPQSQGPASGIATIATDSAPTGLLLVSGTASAPGAQAPSATSMTLSGSISYAGTPLRLTAIVTGALNTVPTGNMIFLDGNIPIATVPLASSSATSVTAALGIGSHTLHASYSGDQWYAPSESAVSTVSIVAMPDFSLNSAAASFNGTTSSNILLPLTCQPLNGTLNHSMTVAVTGLPPGFTASLSPSVFTLSGDPVNVSLTVAVPSTVAATRHGSGSLAVAAVLLLPFCVRRRYVAGTIVSLLALTFASGCGGGFRTVAAGSIGGATPNTHRYSITITATTTGVLGDTLVHSIPIQLVITS